MKIALIGYGKMGKAIEGFALERGHDVVSIITEENLEDLIANRLKVLMWISNSASPLQPSTMPVVPSTGEWQWYLAPQAGPTVWMS